MSDHQMLATDRWVDEYGDYLYRYAMTRARNPELAEELVQETFLAALRGQASFSGKSTMKTWLVGILKHKLIDQFRTRDRERPMGDLASGDSPLDALFDAKGHWVQERAPSAWASDPSKALEQAEFREILRQCLTGLPVRHADAFTLREMEQMDSKSVCKALDVTPTNLWVLLHRARAGLRRCLEISWFGTAVQKET